MLLLSGKITTAQTVDLSTLEHCAGLETQQLKLACFEAIITSSKTPAAEEAKAAAIGASEQRVLQADGVPEKAPAVEVATSVRPTVVATIETSPTVAAVSAVTADVSRGPAANGDFGQEHVVEPEKKAQENDKEVLRAMVTEVSRDHKRLLYFHLDNGHVWRQLEARHFQYPKAGRFEINIARGMMGDYRMRIGDNGRMVRVRRVE